jgi:thioredoxin 1
MGKVNALSEKDFNKFVKSGDCIIDFWAEWCGPCKMIKPVFDEAAEKFGKIKFGKVDVDNNIELAQSRMVMSVPALLFFKNGEEVERVVGFMSAGELAVKIEEVFA